MGLNPDTLILEPPPLPGETDIWAGTLKMRRGWRLIQGWQEEVYYSTGSGISLDIPQEEGFAAKVVGPKIPDSEAWILSQGPWGTMGGERCECRKPSGRVACRRWAKGPNEGRLEARRSGRRLM